MGAVVLGVLAGACGPSLGSSSGEGSGSGTDGESESGSQLPDGDDDTPDTDGSSPGHSCEFPPIAAGTDISFERLANTPDPTMDGLEAVVGLGNRIYLGIGDTGGANRFAALVPADGSVLDLPVPADNPFCSCGYGGVAATLGSTVYAFGNYGHAFDGHNWTEVAYDRTRHRGEAAIAAFRGEVLLMGGRHRDDEDGDAVSDEMQAYDPQANAWRDVPAGDSPFGPVQHAAAAVIDDELFLLAPGDTADLAAWDGQVWTIESAAPFRADRPRMTAYGSSLLVLDGWRSIAQFDAASRSWGDPTFVPEGDDWWLAVADCTLWLVGYDGDGLVVYRVVVGS